MLALKYDTTSSKVIYEYVPIERKPMSKVDLKMATLVPKVIPYNHMSFDKWQITYHDYIHSMYMMFLKYVQGMESRDYLISFDHVNLKKQFIKWLYKSSYSKYTNFTRHCLQAYL